MIGSKRWLCLAHQRRYFSEASMLELTTMDDPIERIHEAVIVTELAAT